MAEYRQGVGPERLPQGGATQLNANAPQAAEETFQAEEIPVLFAPGEDDPIPNDDNGLDEDTQILLEGPDPGYQPRLIARDRPGRVPRYVVRHLPQLMAAVKDPNAPVTLRALYRALVRQLEDEQRLGGD